MKYEEVYEDWFYLFENIAVANDMTGGYEDAYDLNALLKSPTKATAKRCLLRQIDYWFTAGIEFNDKHCGKTVFDLIDEYPKIKDIAEKYKIDLSLCPDNFASQYLNQ